MSHISLTYHLVFPTYKRAPSIAQDHERELYKFMYDLCVARKIKVWRIGGMPDHVHILCDIPPQLAISDIIKVIKCETSKFMRVNPHFPKWKGWCEGYAGFSIEASSINRRIKYIMNQRIHHSKISFTEEYRQILNEHYFSPETPILGDQPEDSN